MGQSYHTFFNKLNNIILTIDFDKYVVISRCPCEITESMWFPIIFLLQSAGLCQFIFWWSKFVHHWMNYNLFVNSICKTYSSCKTYKLTVLPKLTILFSFHIISTYLSISMWFYYLDCCLKIWLGLTVSIQLQSQINVKHVTFKAIIE